MPKTRWWMWTPLSETTLPGHHGTRGLRISRVLMRMKAKERMKPTSTRKMPSRCSPAIWVLQRSASGIVNTCDSMYERLEADDEDAEEGTLGSADRNSDHASPPAQLDRDSPNGED